MSLTATEAIERALAAATSAGAASVDAVLVESDSIEARVRGEEIDFVTQARERSLGIRALVRGADGLRTAITSTSDLAEDVVACTAEDAVTLARATAEDGAAGLPEGDFASDRPDLHLIHDPDRALSLDERIETAKRAEAAARETDPRITNSEGSEFSSSFNRVAYGNSAGFLGEYESAYHALAAMPLASDDSGMQTDHWMTVGRRLDVLEPPEAVGRRAAERALARLGARRIPTCEAPVLFDPMTARSLLGQLLGCVSGYSVYRKSSFLAGRLGEVIASPHVTVVDDGRRMGGLGSKPFDGEGQATRRNVLVEDGRLASYLLDSYSARKLGMTSTGSASRGVGSAPSVGATNLWLEPGNATPQSIIEDTPRGLYVTGLFGHGFNAVTGDFSRGASGMWIENGKLSYPVEEITVAGNLGDLLAGIDAVGNDLLWVGSVAAPTLRVEQLTIAGE